MRKLFIPSTLFVSILLASGLFAQTLERSFEKVTPSGVETVKEYVYLPLSTQGEASRLFTPPGLAWHYPDGGLKWICYSVSLGNRGTQVCAVMELNNERVELFSLFDRNPPDPIWTIHAPPTGYICSSSFTGNYHVALYHVNAPDADSIIPHVHGYLSDSDTPIWTWKYPEAVNAGAKVAIDRDATVVAVAVFNDNTGMLDLFFLDPATGAELSTFSQASPGLRGFDLSADGSTLYFHDGASTCYILDIKTSSIVFSTDTGGSFDSHCISGDGTKFANGSFSKVKIWEKEGMNWKSYTFNLGSGRYGDEMDFSDDGSTLGFGVSQYSPSYSKTEAYLLDIPTKTVTAHVVNNSNGVYQDVCSAAAISHDGRYFVLGRWGDQQNANPEAQILENGAGLVGTIDTRGSVFTVDISRDGQVTVAGGKAIHANVSGNGGDVYCYDLGGEDMDLLGAPKIGEKIELNVYTNPNWYILLLQGIADEPDGWATFSFGTLYLNLDRPNTLLIPPTMQADATGKGTLAATVPNDPVIVGLTVYVQSVFSEQGVKFELSEDYLTLTYLP
jgi:hypothetical protein